VTTERDCVQEAGEREGRNSEREIWSTQRPIIIRNTDDSIENVNRLAIIHLLSSLIFVLRPMLSPLLVSHTKAW